MPASVKRGALRASARGISDLLPRIRNAATLQSGRGDFSSVTNAFKALGAFFCNFRKFAFATLAPLSPSEISRETKNERNPFFSTQIEAKAFRRHWRNLDCLARSSPGPRRGCSGQTAFPTLPRLSISSPRNQSIIDSDFQEAFLPKLTGAPKRAKGRAARFAFAARTRKFRRLDRCSVCGSQRDSSWASRHAGEARRSILALARSQNRAEAIFARGWARVGDQMR